MQVLIVTHYSLPHVGGIEVLSLSQAKALAEFGHDVTIITSRTDGVPFSEMISYVKFIRYNAWNYLEERFGIPYPVFSPKMIFGLIDSLRKTNICIIHSFGFMSSFIAAVLCKLRKIPYVLIQNNQFINYPNPLLNLLENTNDRLIGKFIVTNATEVFSVSHKTKEYVEKFSNKKIGVLKNFADSIFFFPHSSKEKLRTRLGLPVDKFIVLTCGRLVYKKSIDTLLRTAFSLRHHPMFFFLVIGDGADKDLLENYIQQNKLENSVLIGRIKREEIHDYYHASDIFVLPSREGEGSPITLLEAMASSLPIITTQNANQDDIFIHRKNGFIVDTNADEQISKILMEYIEKPAELAIIAKSGRNIVEDYYSIETQTKLLESILLKNISLTK